jgi:HlyD family secretion protein
MQNMRNLTISGLVIVLLMLWVIFRPPSLPVEVATVDLRPLSVSVEEQGRTRARDPFTITAPLSGRMLRPVLEEGDKVELGQALASITLAAENSRIQAVYQAELAAAQARYQAAEASLLELRSAFERAVGELERREALYLRQIIGLEERAYYQQLAEAAHARLLSGEAILAVAEAELESARARLMGLTPDQGHVVEEVVSPVNGTIYQIFERDERVVQAGTPLMSVSNNDQLEMIVDVLTQDAIRVVPGQPVLITGWGGDEVLHAVVRYLEPEAFTKISALGVEEQRVNVIADLLDAPPMLGAGYRINAAIIVWEQEAVLSLPASAVFQRGGRWHVFVVESGRARLRIIEPGMRGREYMEVRSGLTLGDLVVMYPSSALEDGVRLHFSGGAVQRPGRYTPE